MIDLENIVDEAVIINLANEHSKFVEAEMQVRSVYKGKITRLTAVDGNSLTDNIIRDKVNFLIYNCPWSPISSEKSLIGCSLSHQKAWRRCVRNNYKHILVCEDDIRIENRKSLNNAINQLTRANRCGHLEFDILYLGCFGLCKKPTKYHWWDKLTSAGLKIIGYNNLPRQLSRNIFIPEAPGGAHCYVISYQGCKRLLQLFQKEKIITHLDLQINRYRNSLRILAIEPKIAFQDFTTSHLTESSPRLLNSLLENRMVPGEKNMPVKWIWSQKILGLSGWSRIFILLVLLFGWPLYITLITIYLYDLYRGDILEFIRIVLLLTLTLMIRKIFTQFC